MRSPIGRVARKGITEIAMESTGVYWRPVWNVLEGHGFELILANPQQVKALHGRKSDQRDCERIAQFARDQAVLGGDGFVGGHGPEDRRGSDCGGNVSR